MNRCLKVAVDARSLLSGHPRGEGRSLRRLYLEIAALRPDWEIRLYGERGERSGIRVANVTERAFQVPGFRFNLWENVALPLAARRWGAGLIHSTSSSSPRFATLPVVMTVHDIIPLVFDDGQSKAATDRFRTQLEYGLRTARAIIAVSHHTKRDLLAHFNLDSDRIRVIHWGIDMPGSFPADRMTSPITPVPGTHIPYLLAFAGDARRKNTETMIRAFARLPAAGPALVLVGLDSAASRARYGALAAQLGCASRVVMLGYIEDETLQTLLARALALLYLSLYEGFGLPAMEAMASGVPVIASNSTSIPEVVSDAAILVDPSNVPEIADAAAQLIAEPSRRADLIQKGITRARTFRWRTTAELTIEALEFAS